jgi:hypothetical protein
MTSAALSFQNSFQLTSDGVQSFTARATIQAARIANTSAQTERARNSCQLCTGSVRTYRAQGVERSVDTSTPN